MKLSKAIILVAVATLTFTSQCFSECTNKFGAINASKVLPNQGKNNYSTSNLTDLNPNTIWAASFDGNPIYLHIETNFDYNEWPIIGLYIRNGYQRDQKSLINNSRVKDIRIYANSLNNLWTEVTLPDVKKLPKYVDFDEENCNPKSKYFDGELGDGICDQETYHYIDLPSDSPAVKGKKIKSIIIEIVSVYLGQKWNDVCISDMAYLGGC